MWSWPISPVVFGGGRAQINWQFGDIYYAWREWRKLSARQSEIHLWRGLPWNGPTRRGRRIGASGHSVMQTDVHCDGVHCALGDHCKLGQSGKCALASHEDSRWFMQHNGKLQHAGRFGRQSLRGRSRGYTAWVNHRVDWWSSAGCHSLPHSQVMSTKADSECITVT